MSDYDYDSEGYEYDDDYEYEQTRLDKKGSALYRHYLVTRNSTQIESQEIGHGVEKVYVQMFSDYDTDQGLLEGAGGYYSVVEVDPTTLYMRKSIINSLTFRFLLKLNKIKINKNKTAISVHEFEKFKMSINERGLIKKDDNWKDFKIFLTMKFMKCSTDYVENVYNSALAQEFNTNYIEFLVSKSRFIYSSLSADQTMESLKDLHDSIYNDPFENRLDIHDRREDVDFYKNSFFERIKTAKALRVKEHSTAFKNFSV